MHNNQVRGGIERKFLRAILWVGVVPMTLALTIGYVFAREGQWIATQQNQATSAQKTAEGMWLALQARQMMAARAAMDAEIIAALRSDYGDDHSRVVSLLMRMQEEAAAIGGVDSSFTLYDRKGTPLVSTEPLDEADEFLPEWLESVTRTTFVEPYLFQKNQRYMTRILSPVHDPDTGELLGFLAEDQGVQELLLFVLGQRQERDQGVRDQNEYQVVFAGENRAFAVYLEDAAEGQAPVLRYDEVDPRLRGRLLRAGDRQFDSFFLLRYTANRQTHPVMMAYHRIPRDAPLFLVVYRPVSSVFANINLGAVITLVVGGLVIAVFCVIGYRIVNNNIIRPVSLLNEGAQIIRQGDFDLKLKIATGDEIEELANSFNKMASALRQNIKQLEESEEKYRRLITSMRDGIYQTDAAWALTFLNPAGAAFLGFDTPEDAIGANLRGMFVDRSDYDQISGELINGRFVEHRRVWVRNAAGQHICVEISANGIQDEAGAFAGVEGSFRDVTQNVHLETQARERSERISAINQIANVINSSLEAGMVFESIVIELHKLVRFDYAAVALRNDAEDGFDTHQLFPERHSVKARELAAENCAAWVAREGRSLIVENLRSEESPFAAQFPEAIMSCVSAPLHASGRIIGALIVGSTREAAFSPHEVEILEQLAPHVAVAIRNAELLDNLQKSLEEVTQAREKLHEANEELKTLDEMKTNLLSNVSHELRTPLVAVMGYTDMILNGKVGPVNEMQQEYLGITLRNVEKLVTLIENLLDFSRLQRGAEEMVYDTLDLVDCARTSLQIIQPVADSRNISLIFEPSQETILVDGDKGELGQVFNNLLSNAVKFNRPGGNVTVTMCASETDVTVSVSDTGIGIPKEAMDKIFTRFYQVDSSSTRKYGGTGIGLAIAQDIMRLHGSRITVSSVEGQGATFYFSLPLSGAPNRRTTQEETRSPMPTETHLLVELVTQDRALSAQIRNLLLSENMDIIHAAYPAVAVSLANRYSPDCILVDTEAGPLGSVVIEEILSDPSAGNIPILLLTNDDALFEQYRAKVAGGIKRGFRKSTLLSGIHCALSKRVLVGEQLGDKVLCVDDDPEIVTFISRCLETEGYLVDGCATGEEALELAQTGNYWLVLLDIAMPGMDGWETCRRLKSNAALAGLRVYMVTAKPIDKTISQIGENGADGYLLKPFKAEELISLVQSFEERRPRGKSQNAVSVGPADDNGDAPQ